MAGRLGGRWTGGWNAMEYLLMGGMEIFTHGILTNDIQWRNHLWFHTWFIQHSFIVGWCMIIQVYTSGMCNINSVDGSEIRLYNHLGCIKYCKVHL